GLIQEVAYQSLLRSVRQRHHERIARVLESDFSDLAASHPELLAQHYTAAGLALRAFEHWLRAGRRALERSASQEALAHLRAAQELLPRLREIPGRAQRELELYLALGPALLAEQGYTSDNVLRVYVEALRLAEEVGDTTSRFHALCGRFAAHFVRAEFHLARTLADQLLEIAEQTQSDAMAVAAHTAAGITLVEGGACREAHQHLTQAVDLYEMETHAPLMYLSGQDYCVVALCYDGYALWTLGSPERALERAREAVALARSLEHPHSLALALACLAAVHHFRREPEPARVVAEELATLCDTAGFRHWELQVHMFQGWVLCEQGGAEEGIACLREAIAHMQGPAAAIQAFPCYRMLGEALIRAGRAEEALAVLAELKVREESSGIVWWAAEIQRLHAAAVALTPGGEAEAELLLRRALEVAREQQAISLELRIATDLARLLLRQGRAAEVGDALEPVYERFTEGHTIPDLQEAALVLRGEVVEVPTLASP
ncbi:MAG TPA: hypothetical protein VGR27_04505, partial [Longimicrobiaceae bacterium]|nr:hypothetical protein [Longimicrobiaceae bacterium]